MLKTFETKFYVTKTCFFLSENELKNERENIFADFLITVDFQAEYRLFILRSHHLAIKFKQTPLPMPV